MTVSDKVTGDSSLIRAMSLLQRKRQDSDSGFVLLVFLKKILVNLPDEKRVPALVHDDVSSGREDGAVLRLPQAVLAQGHSVLPPGAARGTKGTASRCRARRRRGPDPASYLMQ